MPQTLEYRGRTPTEATATRISATAVAVTVVVAVYAVLNAFLLNEQVVNMWGANWLFSYPIGNGTACLILLAATPIARQYKVKTLVHVLTCLGVGFAALVFNAVVVLTRLPNC